MRMNELGLNFQVLGTITFPTSADLRLIARGDDLLKNYPRDTPHNCLANMLHHGTRNVKEKKDVRPYVTDECRMFFFFTFEMCSFSSHVREHTWACSWLYFDVSRLTDRRDTLTHVIA